MTVPAPLEWVVSRSAAHLRDLVAEAEDAGPGEYEAVAVAGGDGSVRNALAALGSPNRIPFGVVPIGSGNDFAFDLGIPRNPVDALALLADGIPRRVDVGRTGIGTRYCCVASVGLDEVALDVVHHSGLPALQGAERRRRRCGRCSRIARARCASAGRAGCWRTR